MAVFTTAVSIRDDAYRPILRPRRGELTALSHLPPADAARVMPILELEPGPSIVPLLRQLPPRTGAVAIDFGALPEPGDPLAQPWRAQPRLAPISLSVPSRSAPSPSGTSPSGTPPSAPSPSAPSLSVSSLSVSSLELAETLADLGVAMLPVLRPHESDRRLVAHGLAARMHLRRAVLRLRPHVDAGNPAAADAVTERVLRRTGLGPEEVDLLIDLAETVCVTHADAVEERARRVVRWARALPWRSVSVAAGAMPPNLDDLPTDRPVRVGRLDARVWARLGEPGIGYADYGVTSPVRRRGVQRHRQLPTLRYTDERHWWIYRWSRRGARSDDRCQDLCRTLVTSPHWPAAGARFSWGDAELARRARTARGGGSPASWMSWSTSHHIAHVLGTLTDQ